jgi:phage terminase Nu1 subunit (DNA packaging protein)
MSTIAQVCKWCGISRPTFHRALNRGVVAKKPRGEYGIQEVARALIKDGQAAKGGHGDLASKVALSEARAALAREQTAALRLKNAVARGEYVSRAGIRRQIKTMFTMARERLLAIPTQIAATCRMYERSEVEVIVRDEICEVLDEILRLDSALIEQRGS